LFSVGVFVLAYEPRAALRASVRRHRSAQRLRWLLRSIRPTRARPLLEASVDPTTHDVYAVGDGRDQATVAVARFTPAGALDPTFGKGGEVTVSADRPYTLNGGNAAAVDSSGRLVVAGTEFVYDSKNDFYASVGVVYRFTTAGALDKTFNSTGKVVAPYFDEQDRWNAVQIEPSGGRYQIAVAGVYDQQNALAVYNANGTPDTAVGSKGVALLNSLNVNDNTIVQFQPDGRLIELQVGYPLSVSLNRVNTDRTPDTTFGTDGQASVAASALPQGAGYTAVTVDLSGRILLGGSDTVPGSNGKTRTGGQLTRLTPAGALDTAFGVGGSVTQDFGANGAQFTALAVYPAGTPHAGEVLAAGTNSVPPPTLSSDLVLARYQSETTATTMSVSTTSTVASPTTSAAAIPAAAASPYDPEIAPLALDSPDLWEAL
jgi:uncharacterized delta-60 repeat protein